MKSQATHGTFFVFLVWGFILAGKCALGAMTSNEVIRWGSDGLCKQYVNGRLTRECADAVGGSMPGDKQDGLHPSACS